MAGTVGTGDRPLYRAPALRAWRGQRRGLRSAHSERRALVIDLDDVDRRLYRSRLRATGQLPLLPGREHGWTIPLAGLVTSELQFMHRAVVRNTV
jgi:hypothetical protein